jgi:23S rRNA (adenine2503-C2)-methyltransferase
VKVGIIELNSMSLNKSKEFMKEISEKAFRGEQLFSYFNRNKNLEVENLLQFPKDLRSKLKEIGKVNSIKILNRYDSKIDDTKKYLFVLEDNNIIESVFMEYKYGNTACISTQVGCRMGCSFCASTKEGLVRNLQPSEMLNQIYMMEKDTHKDISNVVLMGSGEPLDNYDNVLEFMNIIHDEKGHNMSFRNISLSTCGIVPKIYELAKENIPITLSISLHSPFDEERAKIMPIAKRYKIKELMEACKFYADSTKRRLTFEYTLIENINDGDKEILELSKILKGINAHINLIPLNPIKEYNKERPNRDNIERFQNALLRKNIPATIRRELGSDISASCGQLRRRETNKE